MHWLQVQIELGDLEAEPVEQALLGIGAMAIDHSNAGDDPIFEQDPGSAHKWRTTRLTALFDADASKTAIRLHVAAAIAPAAMPGIEFNRLEDRDWVRHWRQSARPMDFGGGLWVCAPGQACPAERATVVTIVPGPGFGTGSHATTRLCLAWLSRRQPRGMSILDFGCGSGILAIAGVALGAHAAVAVDIDESALAAATDNAKLNNCQRRLDIMPADRLDPAARFDVIVANILSDTLIGLEPRLRQHCHSGTDIALSGILKPQAEAVISAYRPWIQLGLSAEQDDWVLLNGTVH
jgi:ribosomal protein L11 methyltransferase